MAVFFTLAIVKIRQPEAHKRLMTLLMIAIMTPAIARLFIYGGIVLLAQQLLTAPVAASAAWMRIAKAFAALAS
jgi:hypothetical protein